MDLQWWPTCQLLLIHSVFPYAEDRISSMQEEENEGLHTITVSIQITEAKGIWEQAIKIIAFIWETKLNKKQVRQPHARFKSFALILWTEKKKLSQVPCA